MEKIEKYNPKTKNWTELSESLRKAMWLLMENIEEEVGERFWTNRLIEKNGNVLSAWVYEGSPDRGYIFLDIVNFKPYKFWAVLNPEETIGYVPTNGEVFEKEGTI